MSVIIYKHDLLCPLVVRQVSSTVTVMGSDSWLNKAILEQEREARVTVTAMTITIIVKVR